MPGGGWTGRSRRVSRAEGGSKARASMSHGDRPKGSSKALSSLMSSGDGSGPFLVAGSLHVIGSAPVGFIPKIVAISSVSISIGTAKGWGLGFFFDILPRDGLTAAGKADDSAQRRREDRSQIACKTSI